ncbi:hypothetical protein [Bifidobacterium gallicum]|uniref:Uncharacterized protein n=1 Tax=Bifidobacterium gallicum DSM 20093 = LMG 11596 TaxID=561180 RepID=D1NUT1_9BIFI|nr:hypothetical protein [Bifidobacterium gallicum]EFA22582.1 hypothetical protein BIFGAL_03608 [Bifidobacterium gallicum DSM 20093 = LMG 11596]
MVRRVIRDEKIAEIEFSAIQQAYGQCLIDKGYAPTFNEDGSGSVSSPPELVDSTDKDMEQCNADPNS